MKKNQSTALTHGGQLTQIANKYKFAFDAWLDLSTGISPCHYPLPNIPASYWKNLPHIAKPLLEAAQRYYQTQHCIVCHGSQSIIESLPALWTEKHPQANAVYLPKIGYKEHQKSWRDNHFSTYFYENKLPQSLEKNPVVVVINPNNPSGKLFNKNALINLHKKVKALKGLLVIDEAFMDAVQPSQSLTSHIDDEHLIIMRSFGKFFGLAGARIGFVCCDRNWKNTITSSLGPWHVNGPAQYVAQHALVNFQWHEQQRKGLKRQANSLFLLLRHFFPFSKIINGFMFITLYINNAEATYRQLCAEAIYVRLTDEKDSLRFGLTTEQGLLRLQTAFLKLLNENG